MQNNRDTLLLEEINQLDFTVLAEVSLQLFVVEAVEVFDVANVDVPCRTRMNRKR